jgi:hypothetical protein
LFIISCDSSNPSKNHDDNTIMIKADDSNLSDSLKQSYKTDAARLALREIHNDSLLRLSLIEIPDSEIENYYNGIIHIHNQNNIPARDSVFDIYNLHTFLNPEMKSFIVAVDSNANWTQAWRIGNPMTGISQIDLLMTKYDIQVTGYYYWPYYHAAVLQTNEHVNLLALCSLFSNIQGIYFSEPNGWGGDGNDVDAIKNDELINFKFSLGWGDCPSGCISHHYWDFNVYFNGTVEYLGSYGNPITF